MKKSFKKSLTVLLSIIMLMAMAMPVVFAEETAAVAITFADATMEANSETGLRITNLINQKADNAAIEGYYVEGGVITFNFSQEMNVDTLTPENIIITLENGDYIRGTDAENFDSTTLKWGYEPYAKTGTTYSIAISDMCEGIKKHTVTFTSGVKTAKDVAINEVTKNFVTGRIATTQGFEGKYLKDVACGKTVLHQAPPTGGDAEAYYGCRYDKMTTYVNSHSVWNTWAWVPGGWLKIDLGNYYTIADVAAYLPGYINGGVVSEFQIRYSCEPTEDGTTASDLGTISAAPFELAYATKDDNEKLAVDGVGGLGSSSWLHPTNTVRARYIFVKSTHTKYANIGSLKVLATVESDYGQLTATKLGSTVEEFTGAGEYVVSVPVTEYKTGSSNNYMIVAGYDANGVVTMINCKQITEIVDGKLSLATTFTDTTKSLKAVLIKDFTQPQMLTDALHLPATTATQE